MPRQALGSKVTGRDRDEELLAELLRRPLQLELWPTAEGFPLAQAPQSYTVSS